MLPMPHLSITSALVSLLPKPCVLVSVIRVLRIGDCRCRALSETVLLVLGSDSIKYETVLLVVAHKRAVRRTGHCWECCRHRRGGSRDRPTSDQGGPELTAEACELTAETPGKNKNTRATEDIKQAEAVTKQAIDITIVDR